MVTPDEIDAARTPSGGWDKTQLEQWGVPWPPPKGWKERLLAETAGPGPTVHPIAAGTAVRTTVAATGRNLVTTYREGLDLLVDEYVTAETSHNGKAFYWCTGTDRVGTKAIPADHLKVLTEEQRSERTVPTVDEARQFLAMLCGQDDDRIEIDNVEYSGSADDPVTLYGRTDQGLPIAITVKVLDVQVRDA